MAWANRVKRGAPPFSWAPLLMAIAALYLDAQAVSALLETPQARLAYTQAILLEHGVAAVLFSLGMLGLLPSNYRPSLLMGVLPFFSVAFFLSILGMFGTAVVLLLSSRQRASSEAVEVFIDRYPRPELEPVLAGTRQGRQELDSANLVGILSRCEEPTGRLAAVIFTMKLDNKSAVSLLRRALKDPAEDIRLLAYALLSRREKALYNRIDWLNSKISSPVQEANHAMLHQGLVNAYWELVYAGLAEGEAANFLLERARQIALVGLQHFSMSSGLYFQLGRILLLQGELDHAYLAFSNSQRFGSDERKIQPYIREIAQKMNMLTERRSSFDSVISSWQPQLSAASGYCYPVRGEK